MVEKIEAYRTTDGQIFDSETLAQKHQQEVTIQQRLTDFVEKNGYHSMYDHDVVRMMVDNLDELRDILFPTQQGQVTTQLSEGRELW